MIVATAASRELPPVNIAGLRSSFTELAAALSRTDAKLEEHGGRGSRPTGDWNGELMGLAARMDEARMGFAQVRPDAVDLISSMGVDTRTIAQHAGKLSIIFGRERSFSGPWGRVLDQSISDVFRASALLDGAYSPQPPSYPTDPSNPTYPGQPTQPSYPGQPTQPSYPGGTPHVVADAARAAELVQRSIDTIRTVPVSDRGDASTKDARIAAYNLNMDAQKLLERNYDTADPSEVSTLRTADALLEDANWQLAKKPSPDGRFTGVDIPGALHDSQAALNALQALVAAAPAA